MHERIKEHYRDMWLLRTQMSAVSEYTNMAGHLICSGTRLSLLTKTLTGTLVEIKRLFT